MNTTSLKNNLSKILDILFLLIPFIDYTYCFNFSFADLRLSYLIYLIYFVVNIRLLFHKRIIINLIKKSKWLIFIFTFILLTSVFNIYLGNNTSTLLLKQVVIISFIFFTTWLFFYKHNNIEYIAKIYLNIAFIVALIGLFQEISFLIGFKPGYDYGLFKINNQISTSGIMFRVNSIAGDPPMLVYALIVACYISLYNFIMNKEIFISKIKSFIIILALLLTYSTLGYFGFLTSIIIIIIKNYKLLNIKAVINLLILFIISISLFLAGKNSIIQRTANLFYFSAYKISYNKNGANYNTELENYKKTTNESSYTLILNLQISYNTFKNHMLFGCGLGSYKKIFLSNYEKYENKWHSIVRDNFAAASLGLRMMAELGLIGIFIILFFIFRYYIYDFYDSKHITFLILNDSVLVLLIIRLLRNGSYFSEGFFIFALLYYYSKKFYIKNKLNKENDSPSSNT